MINFSTTQEFISSFRGNVPVGTVFESQGYTTVGDGGGGTWVKTSSTGTPSQSPSDLGANLLNDASGYQWSMVLNNTIEFSTAASLQASSLNSVGQRIICRERANANYILQASGYVALAGDLTLASGTVAALQIKGTPNALEFGAVGGDLTKDTAAVQAIIDRGYPRAYLPAIDANYRIEGLVSPLRFALTGDGGKLKRGGPRTTLEAYNTVLTVGALAGSKQDDFPDFENFSVVVGADIINGVFRIQSCRNLRFVNVVVEEPATNWIGTLVSSSRTYQILFDNCQNYAAGFSFMEIGDSAGGEVLDTISFRNTVYNGNAALFQRATIFAFHNISFYNTKFRELFLSEEATLANQGQTQITVTAAAGSTSFTVADSTQFMQGGAWVAGNLLYIGYRITAELVRVSSIVGNVINLETPLRFSHSSDVGGTGQGEPVIFGPVYVTLDAPRSFNIFGGHFERAWAALHLHAPLGCSFPNVFTTSKHLFMLSSHGRAVSLGEVTGGNAGWEASGDGTVYVMYRPPHAQGDIEPWKLASIPEIEATYTICKNDTANTLPLLSYTPPGRATAVRDFTDTYIPARRNHTVDLLVTGAIDVIRLQRGEVDGQLCKLVMKQDANGKRLINSFDSLVSLASPFKPALLGHAEDVIVFRWDHAATLWREVERKEGGKSAPYPRFSAAEIGDIAGNTNTTYKFKDQVIINTTTEQMLRASGDSPAAAWKNISTGADVIFPA